MYPSKVMYNTFTKKRGNTYVNRIMKILCVLQAFCGIDRLEVADVGKTTKYAIRILSSTIIIIGISSSLLFITPFSPSTNSWFCMCLPHTINILITRRTYQQFYTFICDMNNLKIILKTDCISKRYLVLINAIQGFWALFSIYLWLVFEVLTGRYSGIPQYTYLMMVRLSYIAEALLLGHGLLLVYDAIAGLDVLFSCVSGMINDRETPVDSTQTDSVKIIQGLEVSMMLYRKIVDATNSLMAVSNVQITLNILGSLLDQLFEAQHLLNMITEEGGFAIPTVGNILFYVTTSLVDFSSLFLLPCLVVGHIEKKRYMLQSQLLHVRCTKRLGRQEQKLLSHFSQLVLQRDFSVLFLRVMRLDSGLPFRLLSEMLQYLILLFQYHNITFTSSNN